MASEHSSRSFLSGDLIWGNKQSDPLRMIHTHNPRHLVHRRQLLTKPQSRYLSEHPSTYLR